MNLSYLTAVDIFLSKLKVKRCVRVYVDDVDKYASVRGFWKKDPGNLVSANGCVVIRR